MNILNVFLYLLVLINLFFFILSIFYYLKKKTFLRLTFCFGFLFMFLENNLQLGFAFLIDNSSIFWNFIDLFFEIGVLLVLIGFGITVLKKGFP